MAAIKRILVPTDFGDGSEAVLKYACELARTSNASLCVLHTVENPDPLAAYTEDYTPPQAYLDRFERESRKSLDATLTAEQKRICRATLVLRHGVAAQEIPLYLQEHPDVDLVVMATHARGGGARLMRGSVVETIVRVARRPVVTIRMPEVEKSATTRAA